MSTTLDGVRQQKTPPETVPVGYAAALGIYLGADWTPQADQGDERATRGMTRITLVYNGTEADRRGASIVGDIGNNGWSTRHNAGKIRWTAELYYTDPATQTTYDLRAYLPWTLRQQYRTWQGRITCAASKAIERMARDLHTRLIERYLALYAEGMRGLRAAQGQDAADTVLANECAALLGQPTRTTRQDTAAGKRIWWSRAPLTVEGGRVRLDHGFSMTAEEARQFCALVATWS